MSFSEIRDRNGQLIVEEIPNVCSRYCGGAGVRVHKRCKSTYVDCIEFRVESHIDYIYILNGDQTQVLTS